MTEPTHPLPRLAQMNKLRAFAAVARAGNVHRASEALHLSQPAVTRAVRQLEASIGTALFERMTKGMQLTVAGHCAFRRVTRAFEQLRMAGSLILTRSLPKRHALQADRLAQMVTEAMLASLVAIARCGGQMAAAGMVGVSQPALHRNLQMLEHLAGVPLFNRSGRGTHLTESGDVLLMHVKMAIGELRIADEELVSLQGTLSGLVVVGAATSSGTIVPLAAERTLRRHPGLRIRIVDGAYETLSLGLRYADVNLIVGALRPEGREPYALHERLFDDVPSIVVRAGHPLLRKPAVRRLASLRHHEWVVPLSGSPLRHLFEQAFRSQASEPPLMQLEANSPTIVRTLLLSGDRLALVSHRQFQHELTQGVLAVVPVDAMLAHRTVGVARLHNSEPSPGMLALLDALRSLAQE